MVPWPPKNVVSTCMPGVCGPRAGHGHDAQLVPGMRPSCVAVPFGKVRNRSHLLSGEGCGNQSSNSSLVIARPSRRRGPRRRRGSAKCPICRTIGIEIDPFAVRRIVGAIVISRVGIELLRWAAGSGHAEDIELAGTALGRDAGTRKPDTSVGRPSVEVTGRGGDHHARVGSIGIGEIHLRLARAG